MVPLAMTLNEP